MSTHYPALLAQHFPARDDIPAEHRLAAPIHQRTYLIGGQILTWDGPRKAVLSPVCTRDPMFGRSKSAATR